MIRYETHSKQISKLLKEGSGGRPGTQASQPPTTQDRQIRCSFRASLVGGGWLREINFHSSDAGLVDEW